MFGEVVGGVAKGEGVVGREVRGGHFADRVRVGTSLPGNVLQQSLKREVRFLANDQTVRQPHPRFRSP